MSLFLLALCSGNAQADTPPQQRSLLLGGTMEVHAPQVRIDPLLPRGRLIEPNRHERPPLTRCSLRAPVCVHADRPEQLEPALSALQQAFELLVIGLGWPSPWGLSPGVSSLHWSVTDQPLELSVTRRPSRAFDRGHASCHGGPAGPGSAERCVAEAVIAELAPATASWLRAGLAEAARELLQRGDTSGPPSWALAQRQPEEGVLLPASDLRSSLFMNYLMKRSPEQTPLSAPLAALLIAATKTRPGALRYNAEPDLLDALRTNLDGDRTRFARLLDAFAVYRWTEAESEPALLPELAWDIPVSSLPRTLVLPRALAPGGSAYVQIELDQAQAGYVAMRTSCEEPVSYVWSLLVLDENHHVQRHVPVTFREQSFHEEARIGELAHAHALVAVGTSLGGVDLAHPFDPDHGPHERHGCRVTFDALPEPSATARPTQ